jgi:hypothetical protein
MVKTSQYQPTAAMDSSIPLSVPSPARSTYMSFLFLFMYGDNLLIGPRFGQICEGLRGRRSELFRFVGGMLISISFFTK